MTFYAYPTMSMPAADNSTGQFLGGPAKADRWAGGGGVQCQMDIDVGSIIFSHHHLFSLEHYLANKLVEKYNSYQTAKLQQASASLDKRLAILYRAVDELQAKKMSHKSDEEKEFQVYSSTCSNILVQKRNCSKYSIRPV